MNALIEGAKAPEFSLTDKDGVIFNLKKDRGEITVLYFYPKDDTPGCTLEAQEFSKLLPQFKKAGAIVIGISGGTDETKAKFCAKHELSLRLLSDTDFSVATSYGLYGEKKFMGRTYLGIYRTTLVLAKNGKILKIFSDVTPKGHAQEVLEFVRGL